MSATINGGGITDNGTITGDGAISSTIAGLGAVTVSGGTLTLTGDNTYSGATTINGGGTLTLSGTGSISDSSGVADGGTLDISGLTNGGSLDRDAVWRRQRHARRRDTDADSGSGTFSGVIAGSGGLTVDGPEPRRCLASTPMAARPPSAPARPWRCRALARLRTRAASLTAAPSTSPGWRAALQL